jgi:hypothetical protein
MLLSRYDTAHTAGRIRDIATVARNQVKMRMGYGLSRHLSDIHSEIKPIGMKFVLDEPLCLNHQGPDRLKLLQGEIKERRHMSARKDEYMPWRDRKFIHKCEGQRTGEQGVEGPAERASPIEDTSLS